MQLGQAIVQIRKERGLTQEAFSKKFGVKSKRFRIGRTKKLSRFIYISKN